MISFSNYFSIGMFSYLHTFMHNINNIEDYMAKNLKKISFFSTILTFMNMFWIVFTINVIVISFNTGSSRMRSIKFYKYFILIFIILLVIFNYIRMLIKIKKFYNENKDDYELYFNKDDNSIIASKNNRYIIILSFIATFLINILTKYYMKIFPDILISILEQIINKLK